MWVAVSGSSEPPAFTHTKNALFSDLPNFPASQIKKKSQSRKTNQIKKIKSKKKIEEKLNSKSNFAIPPPRFRPHNYQHDPLHFILTRTLNIWMEKKKSERESETVSPRWAQTAHILTFRFRRSLFQEHTLRSLQGLQRLLKWLFEWLL